MRTRLRGRAFSLSVIAAVLFASGPVSAQVNMSISGSYNQNFNTLLNTGTTNAWAENSTLPNWYWQSGATSVALPTYAAGTGSGTAGGGYSYGTTAGDRAMGSICSNGTGAIAYGLLLRNTSGVAITNLQVAYTGEEWRNGGNVTPQVLSFYYRTFTALSTSLNAGTNATWTSLASLNFTSPIATGTGAALDGNASANRMVFSNTAIPSLSLANNDYIFIKWDDPNDSGNDHGLSIDDVTVTWTVNTATPTAGFAPASGSIVEGGSQTVNVSMDIAPSADVKVRVADAGDGTATSGSDYTAFTADTLLFPASGTYPLTLSASVSTIDDANYEAPETVHLLLSLVSGTSNISPNSYTLTITDNDPVPLVINEVDYDNPSTDNAEFVELKNKGITSLNITGYKIELRDGPSGSAYQTITIPSFTLAAGGYYVVGNNAAIPNINLVVTPASNLIQNGSPDAIALRDPANNLIDAVSYEGNALAPYTEGTGISTPNSDDATDGIGISRFPDGSDTNDNSADWGRHCLSPGAANNSSSANCLCSPPEATATAECIDNFTWRIVVDVTSTGSGAVVNITNNVTGSSALGVGVGQYIIGPFNNNVSVNVTVAHETFTQCNLVLNGLFDNCLPDCNGVIGGPDVPGAACDDLNAGTENDVYGNDCICAGTPIIPVVGFNLPSSTWQESDGQVVLGVTMNIAPAADVTVNVTDLFTGTATSGTDYTAVGTQVLTFTAADVYPNTQFVLVTILDDAAYEPTENIRLSLAVVTGSANTSNAQHTLTIQSDDAAPLRINEIDYDQPNTDGAEFVEIKNIGADPVSLSGFSLLLVNGTNNLPYITLALSNVVLAAGDYWVVCTNAANVANCDQVTTPLTNWVQNGAPDGAALRDPNNAIIDAVSYEGDLASPYVEGSGVGLEDPGGNADVGIAIGRYPDGTDNNLNNVDLRVVCITPGASNGSQADADSDGWGDCVDQCPVDPNKRFPGTCGCGVPDVDTDGDLTLDCLDGCPTDPNKTAPGACGCGVPDTDGDGDAVADCIDNCPSLSNPGQLNSDGDALGDACDPCPLLAGVVPNDACNDNNPFTTGDAYDANCTCVGTPVPCDNWTFTFRQGSEANDDNWVIQDANSPFVLASGGNYSAGSSNTATICVPVGACFNLTVTDLGGNGMPDGGWLLSDNNGRRVIDNENNGAAFTTTAQMAQPFCSPVSRNRLIASDCDREDLIATSTVVAAEDTAVSAQWTIGNQTDDGYQFWFFDPVGSYSRKILRTHATSGGFGPPSATRACALALSSIVTNPLPANRLLNVRVRTLVNGNYGNWGGVCRLKIDAVAANCPMTKLIDTPGSTLSCGVTGKQVNGSDKIWARPVTRPVGGSNQPANKYQFQFSVPAEGYTRSIASNSYVLVLGTWTSLPLLCGTYQYDVRVRASFDGGTTWCPWGAICTVGITNNQATPFCTQPSGGMAQGPERVEMDVVSGTLTLWPNPNKDHQLNLRIDDLGDEVGTATLEITDLFGKRAMSTTLTVDAANLNTSIELDRSLASGMYFVQVVAAGHTYTQRLVIE